VYDESLAFDRREPDVGHPRGNTGGGGAPDRVHRGQPGETLRRISERVYYGDSTRWRNFGGGWRRPTASEEDPMAIRPGSLLSVQRLDGS